MWDEPLGWKIKLNKNGIGSFEISVCSHEEFFMVAIKHTQCHVVQRPLCDFNTHFSIHMFLMLHVVSIWLQLP